MSGFDAENVKLAPSWERRSVDHLDGHLVYGVEDPRVKLTSILMRGMLADKLFPGKFDDLIEEEARFSLFITWYLRQLEGGASEVELEIRLLDPDKLPPAIAAAVKHARSAQGVPDYTVFQRDRACGLGGAVPDSILNTFVNLWRMALAGEEVDRPLVVLEAACGSANDYHCLASCGLGRFLDYTGFDISEKNIANARSRFPGAAFYEGSVFEIPLDDKSVDVTMAFDLWEHLSLAGMERGMEEMLRVTREEFLTGYFALYEASEHEEKPVDNDPCGALSASILMDWFAARGWGCDFVWLREWQAGKFNAPDYYNREAALGMVYPA